MEKTSLWGGIRSSCSLAEEHLVVTFDIFKTQSKNSRGSFAETHDFYSGLKEYIEYFLLLSNNAMW